MTYQATEQFLADSKPHGQGKRRGRPSKRDELLRFAEYVGADPEAVGDYIGEALPPPPKSTTEPEPPEPPSDSPPEDWGEWEAEMMRLLWVNRAELKGIAMVQALKAIATLAEHQRQREGPSDEEQVSILDRIDALPREHALELLGREIALGAERLARLEEARERLEKA